MTHACPVAGCVADVPTEMLMCARHWRMVPKPLQAAIYDDYGRTGCRGDNHREAIRIVNEAQRGRASLELPAGTKAFTVWQPWASLIALGAKPHEFRRWKFTDKPHLVKLVGARIVIHAGMRPPRVDEIDDVLSRIEDGESALVEEIARPYLVDLRARVKWKDRARIVEIAPLAAAVCTVTLGEPRSVVEMFKDTMPDSDRLDHHMYGWPMIEPAPITPPIPAVGAQGFWNWS